MIEICIDDEISSSPYFGITETMIAEKLSVAAPGEEILIKINSPGGSVYAGIGVFSLIRETAKTHPVTVKVTGLAASMASYIALAARTVNKESKVIVSENSVLLVHNPWNVISGDYRKFSKAADYLERMAAMIGSTYAYISGKSEKEIRSLMDMETFFIGNESIENGFANQFEEINKEENSDAELANDRNALIINTKLKIEKTAEKMRANSAEDLERAVALITNPLFRAEAPGVNNGSGNTPGNPAGGLPFQNTLVSEKPGEEPGTEGGKMNEEELRAKYPELYAAILAKGKEAGSKEERDRVEAHLKLGEESGSMKIAADFIRAGETVMSNKVQADYLAARMNNGALKARDQDNPGDISTAGKGEAADDAAVLAAWEKGIAGKDTGEVK